MRDDAGWISLHVGEFYLLWTELELGELPALLVVPHIGRTPRARAEFIAAAGQALAERGLGTVPQPAADLADLLRSLAGHDAAIELEVDTREGSLRAIGAIDRGVAVAAATAGTEIRLGAVRASALIPTMLDVLPQLGAARGTPANVDVTTFEAACAAGQRDGVLGFRDALRAGGARGDQVSVVTRAVHERVGGGRLAAKAQDAAGHWRRAPAPLTWLDTPEGRYVIRRNDDWVTVTPADQRRVVAIAEQMLADLAR